ncbi:AAA family ATPase [Enterobacter hormaechei]
MIIWINGPFGAGKTTLAKRLRDRRSKSLIFDPEEIGFVVKETVPMPASGDYQDLPLWRGLTIAAVREIRRNYSQDIIIPMTLVHPDYLTEILDGVRRIDDQLLHIFLTLNEDLLRHRIANQTMHPDPNRNAEIREWRLANVARCLAARERLPCTTRVLDSGAHTSDGARRNRWAHLIAFDACAKRSARVAGSRPNAQRSIIAGMFGFVVRTTGLEPVLSQRSRFSYHLDFRRRLMTFVVWTVPSPLPEGFRRRPSSLYTFPRRGLARDWLRVLPVSVPRL